MITAKTIVWLVMLLGVDPLPHLAILDKYDSVVECNQVLPIVQKEHPELNLRCIEVVVPKNI